jgi:hypothetical protein
MVATKTASFDGLSALKGKYSESVSMVCGPVAQLGARFHGMEEVTGSIPVRSTKINNLADSQKKRDTLR